MTVATLSDVLPRARAGGYAVAGLVCRGWEDMRAYVRAAEAEGVPVILQAGPACRAHTPLPVIGAMMRHLAQAARVPVVAHLDRATGLDECRAALDAGFTSIMFAGGHLDERGNIAATAKAAALAHAAGASCEGEAGVVGARGAHGTTRTDPAAAARLARETGIDALAVSVGQYHPSTDLACGVDRALLRSIEAETSLPLVLHAGTGVSPAERRALARETAVSKINVGLELRQQFGASLRSTLDAMPHRFDRAEILGAIEPGLEAVARQVLGGLKP